MPKTFNVVLTGKVSPGHTREAVAAALANMMRLTEARSLELLSGKETVVKGNLDEAAVARYLAAFGPIGAEVRADPIGAPQPASPAPAPPAAAAAAPAAQPAVAAAKAPVETIKCPACGMEQPKRTLCRQCGVDMPRAMAAKLEPENPPPGPAASSGGARGAAAMKGSVRTEEGDFTPHPLNPFSFQGRVGRLRCMAYAFPACVPLVGGVLLVAVLPGLAFLLAIGGYLLTLWLGMRVAVLRLHDLNLSGIWVLVPVLPLLSVFTGSPMLVLGSIVFVCLGTLALFVWPGNMMSNEYGAPPGPNTLWTIVGAVLFIVLTLIGAFSKPPADTSDPDRTASAPVVVQS